MTINPKKISVGLLLFTAFIVYYEQILAVGISFKISALAMINRPDNANQLDERDQEMTREKWTTVCSNVRTPYPNMTSQSWIPIPGNNNKNFIYSAYFTEIRLIYHVVIVGAQSDGVKYICQIWHWNDRSKTVEVKEEVPVKTTVLPQGHGKRYTASLYKCRLSSDQVPQYVSLVKTSCATPTNLMSVENNNVPENIRNFTICLSPLHNKYNRAYELVEWIELNRILGANKITVYSNSISDSVRTVLKQYSKRGIAEVINWQVPMGSDIHYFGQIAALNDCLYRNKNKSEFVVSLDVDEFIIPHSEGTNTWQQMLRSLNVKANAYQFRNTFFRNDVDMSYTTSVNKHLVDKYQLETLQRFKHESYFYVLPKKGKFIVRTATVTQILMHYALIGKSQAVPISIAFLHHYRNIYDGKISKPVTTDVDVDTIIPDKFGGKLINSVQAVWKDIGDLAMDMP